jgi:hypothetical protein
MNTTIKYAAICTAVVILYLIPVDIIFRNHFSLCIFKEITGKECPLCGMTRASYHLLRANILIAFLYNPASLFLPLLLALEIVKDLNVSAFLVKLRKPMWIAFIAVLLINFVIRLIPGR